MTKAYHSENLLYHLGTFTANKVNFIWALTLVLGLDATTFRLVRDACNVIPLKIACALKWGAPLSGGIGYTVCSEYVFIQNVGLKLKVAVHRENLVRGAGKYFSNRGSWVFWVLPGEVYIGCLNNIIKYFATLLNSVNDLCNSIVHN